MSLNVYIASSWKNRIEVRRLALALRESGYSCYDFTDPNCRSTPEIPPENFIDQFDPIIHKHSEYINKHEWRQAILSNKEAIKKSDIICLLLPCGNDAHADWAYGMGLGKQTAVVGSPLKGDRTLTHIWADVILDNTEQFLTWLNNKG